jgi:hypothetical protein
MHGEALALAACRNSRSSALPLLPPCTIQKRAQLSGAENDAARGGRA